MEDKAPPLPSNAHLHGPHYSQVLKILFQYLKENGLMDSAAALKREAAIELESEAVKLIEEQILAGGFADIRLEVLDLGLEIRRRVEFLILQQQYVELLAAEKTEEALALLRREMTPRRGDPAELHELASLVFLPPEERLPNFSVQESREKLVGRVLTELPSTLVPPPHRLEQLLNQAAVYQSRGWRDGQPDGQLPKDFSFLKDYQQVERLPTQSLMACELHGDEIWAVRLSPDGKRLATLGKDNLVVVCDLDLKTDEKGNPSSLQLKVRYKLRPHHDVIQEVSWSGSGRYLSTGADNGGFKIFEADTGALVAKKIGHTLGVKGLVWLGGGDDQLLTASLDTKLKVWSLEKLISSEDAKPEHQWAWSAVASVAISHSLNKVMVRCLSESRHTVRIYDVGGASFSEILEEDKVISLAVSQDGKQLLTNVSLQFPVLHLWDITSGALIGSYSGHKQKRFELECAFGGPGPNHPYVLAGSEDGCIFIWCKQTRQQLKVLKGHVGTLNSLQWHPSHHNLLISASDDRTIRLWGNPAEWMKQPTFENERTAILDAPSDSEAPQPRFGFSESEEDI